MRTIRSTRFKSWRGGRTDFPPASFLYTFQIALLPLQRCWSKYQCWYALCSVALFFCDCPFSEKRLRDAQEKAAQRKKRRDKAKARGKTSLMSVWHLCMRSWPWFSSFRYNNHMWCDHDELISVLGTYWHVWAHRKDVLVTVRRPFEQGRGLDRAMAQSSELARLISLPHNIFFQ